MAYRVSRERFEKLVEEALEALPEEYREYFTNVTIIVEDFPGGEEARQADVDRESLLGLFSGVPYPDKDGFFGVPYPLPDKITLFRKNIEKISSTEKELVEEIRKTLLHEVGHYFGLSEDDLSEYE